MSGVTSTATSVSSLLTPRHGKLSPSISLEAMDVDHDVQPPPRDKSPSAKDEMNVTSATAHTSASEVRIPGLLVADEVVATAAQQPPQPVELDRPREDHDGTVEDAEEQSRLGKTLSPADLSTLFLVLHMI